MRAEETVTPKPADPTPAAPSHQALSPRRAVFFDVENSSRAEHVAFMLRHLALPDGASTKLAAVGNWRVVSLETARLLARAGAELVHSAPATGVKDWSDLRIAVDAGIWLGTAMAADTLEIVSDDQAFDAVGDVAAARGVVFRRLSLRGVAEGATHTLTPRKTPNRRRRRRRARR